MKKFDFMGKTVVIYPDRELKDSAYIYLNGTESEEEINNLIVNFQQEYWRFDFIEREGNRLIFHGDLEEKEGGVL